MALCPRWPKMRKPSLRFTLALRKASKEKWDFFSSPSQLAHQVMHAITNGELQIIQDTSQKVGTPNLHPGGCVQEVREILYLINSPNTRPSGCFTRVRNSHHHIATNELPICPSTSCSSFLSQSSLAKSLKPSSSIES